MFAKSTKLIKHDCPERRLAPSPVVGTDLPFFTYAARLLARPREGAISFLPFYSNFSFKANSGTILPEVVCSHGRKSSRAELRQS